MVSTHDLVRLIYISRATAPTDSLLVLSGILSVSSRNNSRDEITGVLVVSGHAFVEVIEGSADRVRALMIRIGEDPRHDDIEVLEESRVEGRLFDGWELAAPRITPDLTAMVDAAVEMCRRTPGASIDCLARIMADRSRPAMGP